MFLTLNVICLPYIYFRSQYVSQANEILLKIIYTLANPTLWVIPPKLPIVGIAFFIVLLVHDFVKELTIGQYPVLQNMYLKNVYYIFLIYSVLLFGVFKAAQFIYFQF
jgi:hypothetical protein